MEIDKKRYKKNISLTETNPSGLYIIRKQLSTSSFMTHLLTYSLHK